jgi:hypothetical protein
MNQLLTLLLAPRLGVGAIVALMREFMAPGSGSTIFRSFIKQQSWLLSKRVVASKPNRVVLW